MITQATALHNTLLIWLFAFSDLDGDCLLIATALHNIDASV